MARKVFISYRRDDSRYQARMIYAAFERVLGREAVFMDVDSIPPGANFRKILKDWVDQCDVLLALIGPGWIDATNRETGQRRLDNPNDFVRLEASGSERLMTSTHLEAILTHWHSDHTSSPTAEDFDGQRRDFHQLQERAQAGC
jgi:hypothetical protein